MYLNTIVYTLLILLLAIFMHTHTHTHTCSRALHIKMQYLDNKMKKQKLIKLYLQGMTFYKMRQMT